jgi:hypothetical protein
MGAQGWNDPYDIIPESFREEYSDCDTVADALHRAGARRSTTCDDERERCPFCGSLSVEQRSARSHRLKADLSAWKCRAEGCRRGFDQPADENTIPMTDERADAFDWIDTDELADRDGRGDGPLFATLDEETRTALAIVLYRPWTDAGPSLRELGELFPNSRYWVGERNREWRDGDHRELVPDPTAADVEPITVDASSDATAVATDGGHVRRWDAYGT